MSLKNRIIGLSVIAAAALVVPGAQAANRADPVCDAPATQLFAPWGDDAFYQLVDGGTFEAGATGWSLASGARVVRDLNDGLSAPGVTDEYALELGPGASATSPPICVTNDSLSYRFLSNAISAGTKANLRVEVVYPTKKATRDNIISPVGRSVPSPKIKTVRGQFNRTRAVSIRFTSRDDATVLVDDVYMDPRMH